MTNIRAKCMVTDGEFKDLCRKKNTVSAWLTFATVVIYYGFIFLIAFNKDILAMKMESGVTIGIPLGIGVIVVSWLLTGVYVLWANTRYDAMIERIKDRIGG